MNSCDIFKRNSQHYCDILNLLGWHSSVDGSSLQKSFQGQEGGQGGSREDEEGGGGEREGGEEGAEEGGEEEKEVLFEVHTLSLVPFHNCLNSWGFLADTNEGFI